MATVAIDFGTLRTKLAVYDRRKRQTVVRADVPTLVYVPRSGSILVGEPAQKAIADDPTGMIDDLKKRMGGDVFLRSRRACKPVELISLLFGEARGIALEQQHALDPLTDCILTIPLHLDLRHGELMCEAARQAGFTSVSLIFEPVAASRSWERNQPIPGNFLVVCDIGYTARISVLRRPANDWQPDLEILPTPVLCRPDSSLPSLLFDSLRSVSSEISRSGMVNPPLLVVGGGAIAKETAAILKQEGWPGEVLLPNGPDVSMVLGAIDVTAAPHETAEATTCPEPECSFFPIPKNLMACPICGCPMKTSPKTGGAIRSSIAATTRAQFSGTLKCPECMTEAPRGSATCKKCGFPFNRQGSRPSEPVIPVSNPIAEIINCPECGDKLPQNAVTCRNCGFPLKSL